MLPKSSRVFEVDSATAHGLNGEAGRASTFGVRAGRMRVPRGHLLNRRDQIYRPDGIRHDKAQRGEQYNTRSAPRMRHHRLALYRVGIERQRRAILKPDQAEGAEYDSQVSAPKARNILARGKRRTT